MIPVETPEIGIDQLAEAVRGGAAVAGVREPGEYVAGRIPGAALIPMGPTARRTAAVDRQAPVYVVRASGHRGAAMTDFPRCRLRRCPAAGGTRGWARSGRPVAAGSAPRA